MTIKEQYTTFTAELTVMSPIFIGSGDELNKTMYNYNEGCREVKVANMKLLRQLLAKYNLFDEYSQYLCVNNFDTEDLYKWLKTKIKFPAEIDKIWKYKVSVPIGVSLKNIQSNNKKGKNNHRFNNEKPKTGLHNIKTFIKNPDGKPYIPGSSLKGALRTALMYAYIYEHKSDFSKDWDRISKLYKKSDVKNELEKLLNKINNREFATIVVENDKEEKIKLPKFNAIRVSDSKELNSSDLLIEQRVDLSINDKEIKKNSKMPIVAEMLKIGTKIQFDIIIDRKLDKEGYFTKERIEKALNLFGEEQNEQYKEYKNKNITNLQMPNDISSDLKGVPNICLGGLAGFLSKSVVYAFASDTQSAVPVVHKILADLPKNNGVRKERDKRVAPQVMKLVDDGGKYIPIGWGRLVLKEKELK